MNLRRPCALVNGDTIGIVSPSSPIVQYYNRIKRAIRNLEKIGFKLKVGKNALKVYGNSAGSVKDRIKDLHSMFEDSMVKMIICSLGGYTSNALLDFIDYDIIHENPKIFIGYSDITALHCAINVKAHVVTYYGPALLPQFGEFPKPLRYTVTNMINLLSNNSISTIPFTPSKQFTYEHLSWDKEDTRPRRMISNPGWKFLKDGKAQGQIIGGHLGTLTALAGTKYFPDFKGKILFLDETESSTAETDRMLTHLRMLGICDQIEGMIIGRINPLEYEDTDKNYDFEKLIVDFSNDYDFPVVINFDIGHTDPMLTLPIGVNAFIDTYKKTIGLLEPAVK